MPIMPGRKVSCLPDAVLAEKLGLSMREFQRYRAQGLVSVSIEDNQGSSRVTCGLGNRVWEGTVERGVLIAEEVRYLRGVKAQSGSQGSGDNIRHSKKGNNRT
ncbi:hypothetical protein FZ934_20755 (plasmid) [Rhizobium grahamii]|uniref:Uncharacterized protein n=1 Tax=Rhizobium grahamii TaxID=1120045 RepID=A0A5Q0CFF4_9HYPH|nr:hypothetical protein FZ934_20755 [Rhizobium grahamii]QRM53086.1 hypothetical protein F3Y33_24905 [Rhizobium sp. BG6]